MKAIAQNAYGSPDALQLVVGVDALRLVEAAAGDLCQLSNSSSQKRASFHFAPQVSITSM
jgi:hypothetical protein